MGIVKKFRCIAKIKDVKGWRFVKHHVNDLIKYTAYLERTFESWAYFNVYDKSNGDQIGNFTKKNKPTNKHLWN